MVHPLLEDAASSDVGSSYSQVNIDATVIITYVISDFTHVQCISFINLQELILRSNYQNQASIEATLQHYKPSLEQNRTSCPRVLKVGHHPALSTPLRPVDSLPPSLPPDVYLNAELTLLKGQLHRRPSRKRKKLVSKEREDSKGHGRGRIKIS